MAIVFRWLEILTGPRSIYHSCFISPIHDKFGHKISQEGVSTGRETPWLPPGSTDDHSFRETELFGEYLRGEDSENKMVS